MRIVLKTALSSCSRPFFAVTMFLTGARRCYDSVGCKIHEVHAAHRVCCQLLYLCREHLDAGADDKKRPVVVRIHGGSFIEVSARNTWTPSPKRGC